MGNLKRAVISARKNFVNRVYIPEAKMEELKALDAAYEADIKEAQERAARKKEKAEEKAAEKKIKLEKKAEKKASKIPLRERVSNFFTLSEDIEIEEDMYNIFYGENDEQYDAVIIEATSILNEKKEAFAKDVKGQLLLKRDLKTSPLYVADEGNFIRVNSIKEVFSDADDGNKVFLMLETKYEYFVIAFEVIRSF